MKRLKDIPNLSPEAIELLQSAGYLDVASLKKHTLEEITVETSKTNEILDIFPESPTDELLAVWLEPLGFKASQPDITQSTSKHVIAPQSLLSASFAIPISPKFAESNNITVENLPAGSVKFISEGEALKHMSVEELEATPSSESEPEKVQIQNKPIELLENTTRVEVSAPKTSSNDERADNLKRASESAKAELDAAEAKAKAKPQVHDQPHTDIEDLFSDPVFSDNSEDIINKSRIIDMETFRKAGSRIEPLVSASAHDLTRSTKQETNEGVDPSSRRFIKGVLHSRAGDFMVSTFFFLLSIALFLSAFVLTPLLFLDKHEYWWAAFAPLLMVVGIFVYFAFTRRAMCPICNQKQYAIKRCLKHRNAHHWGMLGYMLPTAIHVVLFKWFRCIFCGTSVRLKE